ncbi:hypothetical protein PIB30_087751, partial [Stylosanthes scabra]|nr:hypothetical protein [Stylosanthes scabra]
GRSLRERLTKEEGGRISAVKSSSSSLSENNNDKANNNNVFDPKQEDHELDTMDYTPAGKNPPIHN